MELLRDVRPSITCVDPAEWDRLGQGGSLYQSHAWLSWAESSCGVDACYVLVRDPGGELVGAVPAYLLPSADTTWNSWYDPLAVHAGHGGQDADHRARWFPLLLVGSVSGYHSEFLIAQHHDAVRRAAVMEHLVEECRALARRLGARGMAMMYAPGATAAAAAGGGAGVVGPIRTSANTRIHTSSWTGFDDYLASFSRRRRYNIQRELDVFEAEGSRVVETRLSHCLDAVGPLLGSVHRKHGAADSDEVTTEYLRSQADFLDDLSTVFLELSGDIPVGFSLCYEWDRELYVRVVGFDYARSSRFAYFSLAYYRPLAYAIRRNLRGVQLGPGTYQAKAARGATLPSTWSLVWPPDDERAWFQALARPGQDAVEADAWVGRAE